MWRLGKYLFLIGLLVCMATPAVAQPINQNTPVWAPQSNSLQAYVEGVVEGERRDANIPGAVVAVTNSQGLIFSAGYGYADLKTLRPIDPDETLMRIGSVSKTFVWTAVLILVDRGQLDLDANVAEYLGEDARAFEFDAPLTLRHLMSHTGGFEDTFSLFTYPDDSDITLTSALEDTQPKQIFPPGERPNYSNWGTALAAKIVEDVSGKPLEAFLKTEVFDPLGFGPIAFNSAQHPELMSKAYQRRGGGVGEALPMQVGPFWPAGGLAISANDMALWLHLFQNDGAWRDTQIISQFQSDSLKALALEGLSSPRFHLGFSHEPYRGVTLIGHAGSTGNFETNWVFIPELDLGIFVSQNRGTWLAHNLPKLIVDRALDETYAPSASSTSNAMEDRDLTPYTGTYFTNRRAYSTFEKFYAFESFWAVSATPSSLLIGPVGGRSDRYTPVADTPHVFEDAKGRRVRFALGADDQVSHFVDRMGTATYDKRLPIGGPSGLLMALSLCGLLSLTGLAAMWRRQGRAKNEDHQYLPADILSHCLPLIGLGYCGLFVVSAGALQSIDAGSFVSAYPPAGITLLRGGAWLVGLISCLSLPFLAGIWIRQYWSFWRRVHVSLLALSLIFLTLVLVSWRLLPAGGLL